MRTQLARVRFGVLLPAYGAVTVFCAWRGWEGAAWVFFVCCLICAAQALRPEVER